MQFGTSSKCISRLKKFVFDTSGTALVEFGMTIWLLLLIVFGTIMWGYYLSVTDSMYNAARHAARELSVSALDDTNAEDLAEEYLSFWPIEFNATAEDASAGNEVKVTITANNPLKGLNKFVAIPEDFAVFVIMRKEPGNATSSP